jgi:hypothetical protein
MIKFLLGVVLGMYVLAGAEYVYVEATQPSISGAFYVYPEGGQ